jgi:hypothetical protein
LSLYFFAFAIGLIEDFKDLFYKRDLVN